MGKVGTIIPLMMLFLVGFIPSKGASYVFSQPQEVDSLPITPAVEWATDGLKQLHIYKDHAAADSLFRLSIAADSLYAPAYYAVAQAFASGRGAIDSVLLYAARAYELDSLNKWYSDLYAQSLAVRGHYSRARRLYSQAIEREPQNAQNYVMVAMLYSQTGEQQKAIEVLDSAQMRAGNSSYLSSLKRELLLASGQRDKAIAEVEALVEMDPSDRENYMILSDLYISTKQDSLAQLSLERALAVDSTSLEVLQSLAQFHADRGNMLPYFAALKRLFASDEMETESKIAQFNRLTSDITFYQRNFYSISELAMLLYSRSPTDQRIVQLMAQHQIVSGSLDKALELYKKHAAEDLPPVYDYYTAIIDIESYRQRPDSVELYASRAIELFPNRHELRLSLANLYSYTKRYDMALESYKRLEPELPSDSLRGIVLGNMGDLYHQMSLGAKPSKAKSLMRKAYKAYDRSLAIYPANAMVLNNYAYFLSLEQRELARALEMSGRATALVEGSSTYLDTYAWILYELGRYAEAKRTMRQVIALDTTQSAEIQFHYAEILAALGEDFMAEVYYDKAAKLGYDESVIKQRRAKLKE